jgi:hypothetical protein
LREDGVLVERREPPAHEMRPLTLPSRRTRHRGRVGRLHADGARKREVTRGFLAVSEPAVRHRELIVEPVRVGSEPESGQELVAHSRECPPCERDAGQAGMSCRGIRRDDHRFVQSTLGLLEPVEADARLHGPRQRGHRRAGE